MLLLPTACNPLHSGHLRMAHYAEKMTGEECEFVISTRNADKDGLPPVEERVLQLQDIARNYIITSQKTFIGMASEFFEKCKQDEKLYFIVGIDTIVRINDIKYSYNSPYEFERMLRLFGEFNVRFIICERGGLTISSLPDILHPDLLKLCMICEGYYENGESSTAIRQAHNQDSADNQSTK